MNNIIEKLDLVIPNPRCELNYQKDYELLIATVLSAQCTDARVNQVTEVLFKKYPDINSLNNASLESIKKIIHPCGNFNKKSEYIKEITKNLIADCQGKVPNDFAYLINLPGVGRKTINVVLSELYNIPTIAVDTHVERVSKRLNLAKPNDDVLTIEQKLMKKFPKEKWNRINHQLVLFGRYHCKSVKPDCLNCPLKGECKYYEDNHQN